MILSKTQRDFKTGSSKSNFKTGNSKSNFAKHLLDKTHSMGPLVKIMNMIPVTRNEHMNVLEKFLIYFENKNNNQLNDSSTVSSHILFDAIITNDVSKCCLN